VQKIDHSVEEMKIKTSAPLRMLIPRKRPSVPPVNKNVFFNNIDKLVSQHRNLKKRLQNTNTLYAKQKKIFPQK